MTDSTDRNEALNKLSNLVNDIKIGMLVTVTDDGQFHSRPMITQAYHVDGNLWFFAKRLSDTVHEIEQNPTVNVSYSGGDNYVSIAGKASLVFDVEKKKELWEDSLKIWFEEGPESPDVALVHVQAISAQYWDTPSTMFGKAVGRVKVMLTGDKDAIGDSDRVQF